MLVEEQCCQGAWHDACILKAIIEVGVRYYGVRDLFVLKLETPQMLL